MRKVEIIQGSRKGTVATFHGFFQVGNAEHGMDPVAVIEFPDGECHEYGTGAIRFVKEPGVYDLNAQGSSEYVDKTSKGLTSKGLEYIKFPAGKEFWLKDGRLHRIDGPAVRYPDGFEEYRVDGMIVEPFTGRYKG